MQRTSTRQACLSIKFVTVIAHCRPAAFEFFLIHSNTIRSLESNIQFGWTNRHSLPLSWPTKKFLNPSTNLFSCQILVDKANDNHHDCCKSFSINLVPGITYATTTTMRNLDGKLVVVFSEGGETGVVVLPFFSGSVCVCEGTLVSPSSFFFFLSTLDSSLLPC